MKKTPCTIQGVGIRYGLYLMSGLILYFLLMKLLGLEGNLKLRYFNIVILILAIVSALHYYKTHCGEMMAYFKGIAVGVLTSMVGAVTFALFMALYLGVFDPAFLQSIQDQWPGYSNYINPFTMAFIIILEGVISGYLTTFITLQYMKSTHYEYPTE